MTSPWSCTARTQPRWRAAGPAARRRAGLPTVLFQDSRYSGRGYRLERLVDVIGADLDRSDPAPFWNAKVPSVMTTDTAPLRNPHYHRPTDTAETLDYDRLAAAALATAEFAREWQTGPRNGPDSRVNAKPKAHIVDSGLAARLLRLNPDRLATLDPAALTDCGHLLETFVVGEIRKQASWLSEPVALGHWRTSDRAEVDLVIESDDGTVIGLKVKASERAPAAEFRGLEQLRELLGPRFTAGIILTTGRRSYTYADRLHVMPIDRLWTPVTSTLSSATPTHLLYQRRPHPC